MLGNKKYNLALRTAAVFAALLTLALICIVRLLVLCSSDALRASARNNSYSINISRLRGTIFDTNMAPITNAQESIVALVSPTEQAIIKISTVLSGDMLQSVLDTLKSGKVAVVKLKEEIECDGIECIKIKEHITENSSAQHLIGYLDSSGHGVCGLEAAFDDILYTKEFINVKYSCDAKGNLLYNRADTYYNKSVYNTGVVTTIDLTMQQITEEAMANINKGAAVVLEASTGKIRAMVSKPSYDQTDVSKYLSNTDAPLINRALTAYDTGSVFKPCIASAALDFDANLAGQYVCTGSEIISGHKFVCNNHSGHGKIDISAATAYSCNTYFYTLAVKTGAERLFKTASNYPFGQEINLAPGIKASKGNLTALSRLQSSDAAIANFAIGQGDLLISPIALATLYDAIASDGVYTMPSLIEKTITANSVNNYKKAASTRVMSKETAYKLKEYLKGVVLNGTGIKAKPTFCTAAGKTATAQTGTEINGEKVSNGWFCGFFPADAPKYIVVIVAEGANSGGTTAAPIFSKIADDTVKAGLLGG